MTGWSRSAVGARHVSTDVAVKPSSPLVRGRSPVSGSSFRPRRMKVCMAASGGGHLLELLELRPAVEPYDVFFVTEDTAQSKSLAARSYFVNHFAVGQIRLGAPMRMIQGATANLLQSFRIIRRERPDVVISTGAGAVFFVLLWARLLGAKVLIIESFARFKAPSLFFNLTAPFAQALIIQSLRLKRFWPKARVFDPASSTQEAPAKKEPLVFVTVGTVHSFDRMVGMVARAKCAGLIPEAVIMQIGDGVASQANIQTVPTLSFQEMGAYFQRASIVVCHGGVGSIMMALRYGCHVIAVPRCVRLKEHYDDHQLEITQALKERGLIHVANTDDELAAALITARASRAVMVTSDASAMVSYVDQLLCTWSGSETETAVSNALQ